MNTLKDYKKVNILEKKHFFEEVLCRKFPKRTFYFHTPVWESNFNSNMCDQNQELALLHIFTGKPSQSAGDSHFSGHWLVPAGEC